MSAPRLTAQERREQTVQAAMEEFAAAGLAGASTERIAQRAGISHAYLFRLFTTKRELFLACVDAWCDHVRHVFAQAWEEREPAADPLHTLGAAYVEMVDDPKELLFQFHAFAAAGDEDIREHVGRRYMEVFDWVGRTTGASEEEVRVFFGLGLLIAAGRAVGEPRLLPPGTT